MSWLITMMPVLVLHACNPLLPCPTCCQVEYYLALHSNQFIGNSVSTSNALLIMERWRADIFATYYNGGNIPLEHFVPLFA